MLTRVPSARGSEARREDHAEDDLRKPQVLVESAYGMGHPRTFHFRNLIEEVSNGVFEAGGTPADFVVSDICDGVVQATDGMNYSLVSRSRRS
jgi:dihydroxy-acid dehydratase